MAANRKFPIGEIINETENTDHGMRMGSKRKFLIGKIISGRGSVNVGA